ncbi:LacI family transcriptional regulator [Pigmentiphaga sp. NML080357]|uniref:Bug family tripartite tricarboxylate transporter substrate binding protein n=1 Tax=Pigmentiphaga sp. NML080357 TaxID=2008675 RepID=UPI000B419813|nr:tripartite tricarboxylate transporter substrate binding protein [Pigmentiphaga sp. NML080357]OVZ60662.1 LacI family transcriptional regulator [Pigmentiphaga sp. NML080357]
MPLSARPFIALAVLAAAVPAHAAYPEKPITFVVPFPPGGTTDIIARSLAARLGAELKQTVIVENRPGAGGNVGAQGVARAQPDGYTLLLSTAGPLSINQHLYKNPGYDPATSFAPVALVAAVPIMLVANPSAPFKTAAELIDYARKHPDKLSYGSQGNGTTSHLTMELLKTQAGVSIQHIPYRGSAPAATDLMGGVVQVMFDNSPSTLPFVKAGKMRALGVASPKRVKGMDDLPSLSETLPGFASEAWFGLVAPAATPAATVDILNKAINRILSSAEYRQELANSGTEPLGGTPADFAKYRDAETAKWGKIVQAAGIKLD